MQIVHIFGDCIGAQWFTKVVSTLGRPRMATIYASAAGACYEQSAHRWVFKV